MTLAIKSNLDPLLPLHSCRRWNTSIIEMSQFDAAPPNTHAGGNDDALRTKGTDPMNATTAHEIADERVNMEEYGRTVPLWKRVWQNSLTQMFLLSVQAFCGPAMADAIAGMQSKKHQGT
jgi:hypothetical protein